MDIAPMAEDQYLHSLPLNDDKFQYSPTVSEYAGQILHTDVVSPIEKDLNEDSLTDSQRNVISAEQEDARLNISPEVVDETVEISHEQLIEEIQEVKKQIEDLTSKIVHLCDMCNNHKPGSTKRKSIETRIGQMNSKLDPLENQSLSLQDKDALWNDNKVKDAINQHLDALQSNAKANAQIANSEFPYAQQNDTGSISKGLNYIDSWNNNQ